MRFSVKSRWDGSVLFETDAESMAQALELAVRKGASLDGARLVGASLDGASLVGASLVGASLDGASLDGARLVGASLDGASLDGASLDGARLDGARLVGAMGLDFRLTTPLAWLFDQPGNIRSYKLVTAEGFGPVKGGIKYAVGEEAAVEVFEADPTVGCGAGVNLATLDWCLRNYQPGFRILVAEHTAEEIVCVPMASDGKYRVKRCRIVDEKPEWWIRSAMPWLDAAEVKP